MIDYYGDIFNKYLYNLSNKKEILFDSYQIKQNINAGDIVYGIPYIGSPHGKVYLKSSNIIPKKMKVSLNKYNILELVQKNNVDIFSIIYMHDLFYTKDINVANDIITVLNSILKINYIEELTELEFIEDVIILKLKEFDLKYIKEKKRKINMNL